MLILTIEQEHAPCEELFVDDVAVLEEKKKATIMLAEDASCCLVRCCVYVWPYIVNELCERCLARCVHMLLFVVISIMHDWYMHLFRCSLRAEHPVRIVCFNANGAAT